MTSPVDSVVLDGSIQAKRYAREPRTQAFLLVCSGPAREMTAEGPGVASVTYDIASKPPSTMEGASTSNSMTSKSISNMIILLPVSRRSGATCMWHSCRRLNFKRFMGLRAGASRLVRSLR